MEACKPRSSWTCPAKTGARFGFAWGPPDAVLMGSEAVRAPSKVLEVRQGPGPGGFGSPCPGCRCNWQAPVRLLEGSFGIWSRDLLAKKGPRGGGGPCHSSRKRAIRHSRSPAGGLLAPQRPRLPASALSHCSIAPPGSEGEYWFLRGWE